MLELKSKKDCSGCHSCFNICPVGAISMDIDDKGFKYPTIDKKRCINCGMCERVCPIINSNKGYDINEAYAMINNDEKTRLNSSSGGIFSLLANTILSQGGIIFGAAFDEDMNVHHISISNKKDLYKLMTSKYLQSSIGNTYKECKEYLEKGKPVLFTGVPCQIEGLYSFLKKEYDNLYTQDLICYGAPSPKIRQMYLKFMENKKGIKTGKANFREKSQSRSQYSLSINNGEYKMNHSKDPYMKLFAFAYIMRESCYSCKFKKMNRLSDITLADFWGIDNVDKSMNDKKGTSFAIIHSDKGKKLFNKIKNSCKFKWVNFNESIGFNPAYYSSVKTPKDRESLFRDINEKNFDEIAKKYTGGFIKTIRALINRIFYNLSIIYNRLKRYF